MSRAFQYKPKFGVDIRVRPPKAEEEAQADVHTLRPGQRRCEWPDCLRPGECRAPKSRDLPDAHYWFCQPHAGEYNKGWNFFAGMDEGQQAAYREAAAVGERPTWQFKASRFSREAASTIAKDAAADPLGLFAAARRRAAQADATAAARKMGKLERRALAELDLDETAEAPAVRARYLDLVKRFHPDSNGGDRTMEQKLTRVLKAYKTLKTAKLV